MNEQRRFPRRSCAGTAELQISPTDVPFPAKIADLSVEGCLLILLEPKPIQVDTLVELVFCVNHLPFRVRAQVRSVRSETALGFLFPALSRRVRDQLEDLVEELAEDRFKNLEPVRGTH